MALIKEIMQFRLSLLEVRPAVWRRIQVPADCTLARLHKIIQAVMGWHDSHLHEFTVAGRIYGDPEIDEDERIIDDRMVRLRNLNLTIGDHIQYAYDFGDNWQHVLELENRTAPDRETLYPRCIDGECSAPPEDVGGISGYEQFLEALFDPSHEDHEDMKTWVGRPFSPSYFSVAETNDRLRKILRLKKR